MKLPEDPLEQLSDQDLIAAFVERRGRDDRPFTVLFHRHRAYVAQVARRFVPGELVDDVTQDVFVAAHTKLAGFEGRSQLRTWLHTLVVNRCKNALRGRQRRQDREAAGRRASLESSSRGVRHIEARVVVREVSRALAALPLRDREALRLVGIEERPYSEASRLLGISASALKMRVLRARLALRDSLGWGAA